MFLEDGLSLVNEIQYAFEIGCFWASRDYQTHHNQLVIAGLWRVLPSANLCEYCHRYFLFRAFYEAGYIKPTHVVRSSAPRLSWV